MARFVVVEIPDNDEALAFIKAITSGRVIYGTPREEEGTVVEVNYVHLQGATVPAAFAVPTKLCECPDYNGKGVRSTNYGWFVCAKCKKPRGTSTQYPYNLIERHKDVRERVYTMGWRADRKSAWGK